ncbi:SEL1-like repeat protein [Helicobacter sp. NHP22-001]
MGHAQAHYAIAVVYHYGYDREQNTKKAREHYQKAVRALIQLV